MELFLIHAAMAAALTAFGALALKAVPAVAHLFHKPQH